MGAPKDQKGCEEEMNKIIKWGVLVSVTHLKKKKTWVKKIKKLETLPVSYPLPLLLVQFPLPSLPHFFFFLGFVLYCERPREGGKKGVLNLILIILAWVWFWHRNFFLKKNCILCYIWSPDISFGSTLMSKKNIYIFGTTPPLGRHAFSTR